MFPLHADAIEFILQDLRERAFRHITISHRATGAFESAYERPAHRSRKPRQSSPLARQQEHVVPWTTMLNHHPGMMVA